MKGKKTVNLLFALGVFFLLLGNSVHARIKLVALPERGKTIIHLDNPGATLIEEERVLKVYRNVGEGDHLSYEGQSKFKYIPVNEDVELNLGAVANVIVKPTLMDYKTDRYLFDNKGNISGWDEVREFEMEVKNTRDLPIKVEIKRNFKTSYWETKKVGDFGLYEKVDLDTVKFTLSLLARETKKFRYILTTHHGRRAD